MSLMSRINASVCVFYILEYFFVISCKITMTNKNMEGFYGKLEHTAVGFPFSI